ncbi:YheC/YheD family endospore coat-associated protein [Cytobacillus gottheilii]|uniref:YheC/YheD family endospore coat-associated protein n=1 Tax=Cytobacillus gottheilii TaxID=859144 RepID=UPI0009BA4C6B|nr:YheC/YheD family protein [Cytobacillus gottheilii]
MKKQYQISRSEDLHNTIIVPSSLKLPQQMKITFGTHSAENVEVKSAGKEGRVILSSELAKRLLLPDLKVPLHLFIEGEEMVIGPLIGIFTSGFTSFPMRPIGDRTMFFAKLLSVKSNIGAIPFVFGEQHINWEQGTINGYFYFKEGWITMEVPYPNAIYDRLPNRKTERQKQYRAVKARLQEEYFIPWYNPGFFNKLDISERLQQTSVEKYLPETHPFTSFSIVERMLADYGHVYMKPINGSLGLGIHQIIYDRQGEAYYCRYRDENKQNKLQKFSSLEALSKYIFKSRNLNSMLVQQGIHLIRKEQRPIDFRVHTNKDEHGEWQISALAAKVAGRGSVTTHVKSGGVIMTAEEIFTNKEEQKQAVDALSKAALEISKALEGTVEGLIGEIGFDLGLDRLGNVWLFEANSKPGRSIFKHPELREFDLLTRKLSLSYAVFLTEKSITSPGEVIK